MTAGEMEAPRKMPTVDEIFGPRIRTGTLAVARPALSLVAAVLPTVGDDLTANLLEYVALALAHHDDEIRAIRAVLSPALALSHTQHVEILRLRRHLADLLDARRRERTTA